MPRAVTPPSGKRRPGGGHQEVCRTPPAGGWHRPVPAAA